MTRAPVPLRVVLLLFFTFLALLPSTESFFLKWPWISGYPNGVGGTTTVGGATSVNYGFLRPGGLLFPQTTTTTTSTTAATTTEAADSGSTSNPFTQLLLTVLLGSVLNKPPVFTGVAQPLPAPVGVVGGGVATTGNGGGFLFPGGGFAASGGILPGLFPPGGIFGRSRGYSGDSGNSGILFRE